MEDFTKKTLGELLSDNNETIRRNAISILKQLQKEGNENSDSIYKKIEEIKE